MPEVIEPPPAKEAAPAINPQLAKLFEIKIPEKVEDKAPVEKVPEVPPEKKEEPVVPIVEDKKPVEKSEITSRLAPDFTTPEKPLIEQPVKPEPLKITDEMIDEAKTPKAKADMRKFRESYEALETELTQLRSRPTVPPEDTETKTLLETVTRERDDALVRLERTDLLSSPKFQREFIQPRDKDYAAAQTIVKDAGGDPNALNRAMGLTGKARIDLLDEIREAIPSDMMKGRFDRLLESVDARTIDINEKLKNSRQAAEELAREETANSHERLLQTEKQLGLILDSALRDLQENVGLEVLTKTGKPDFKWFDDQVDEIHTVAREVYLKATPEKAAVAAVLAASAGPYRDMFLAERKARLAVEKENQELKGAGPTLERDRTPVKADNEGTASADILGRLRAGAYKS